MENNNLKNLTFAGFLISIGIVFGDIGTSPLYTYQAIIGTQTITELIALGGASAIFWTLTFQTTVKYVFITLKADNKGEGGIFSLYALIRKYRRWLLFPAMTGGSFLLADSINLMYLERINDFYNKMKPEEKEGYKNANIIIGKDGIENVSDSVTIINYSNSFKNMPSKIKVIKVNGEWLVDFKYTFSGNL